MAEWAWDPNAKEPVREVAAVGTEYLTCCFHSRQEAEGHCQLANLTSSVSSVVTICGCVSRRGPAGSAQCYSLP